MAQRPEALVGAGAQHDVPEFPGHHPLRDTDGGVHGGHCATRHERWVMYDVVAFNLSIFNFIIQLPLVLVRLRLHVYPRKST